MPVVHLRSDKNANEKKSSLAYPVTMPNLRYFSKTTITAQKNFLGPLRGSGGMLPQKILKMKVLKLAKIAFQTALYCHVDYSK